jgi:hypothetical protein
MESEMEPTEDFTGFYKNPKTLDIEPTQASDASTLGHSDTTNSKPQPAKLNYEA